MKTRIPSIGATRWAIVSIALALVASAGAQAQDNTVNIYSTDSMAAEALSDPGVFMVRRTGATNFPLLVFYQISGTASNGVDYEQIPNTVQIPAGALDASFSVKPIDDSLVEGTESVVIRITPSPMLCPTCGYTIGDRDVAEVLIADNDPRDGTNDPPVVRLNEPQNGDIFRMPANITLRAYAQDTEDHFNLRVEFLDGTNRLGFGTFVPTLCPAPYCPYFQLTWSNAPSGQHDLRARVTDSHGATTVSDPVYIQVIGAVNIYATDPDASEIHSAPNIDPPSNPAVFTVRRFGETDYPIVVFYEISGTASNGVDYQTLPGYVSLPQGVSSAEIVVQPISDNLIEGTETVVLTLRATCPQCLFVNPPCLPPVTTNCYALGPDNTAVAYIHDSAPETNHVPFVELTAPRDGETFVAPANITLVAFAQDQEDHYTLQIEFFEGTHSLGFGTFNPTRCWPGCPNYILTWSKVAAGQYTLTARATDSGGASSISQPVHITVSETSPPPVVNIVARDPFASEGTNFWREYPFTFDVWNTWGVNIGRTNTATFVVRRSIASTSPLTVNYLIGGTALNGIDYRTLPGSVQIPGGSRTAHIVVMPMADSSPEGTETVVLRLSPSPNYTIGVPSQAAAIIIDNDKPRPPCGLLLDRRFHVCQAAENGFCFRLESSSDLRNWTPLCTNIVTDGALHFVDPDQATNARFYRVFPDLGVPPDD